VVAGILGEQTSDGLVQDLEQKHDFVRQRVQKFTEIANDGSVRLPLYCFYETEKTQILRRVLPRSWAGRLSSRFSHKIVRCPPAAHGNADLDRLLRSLQPASKGFLAKGYRRTTRL
jgi:hypothetical protein